MVRMYQQHIDMDGDGMKIAYTYLVNRSNYNHSSKTSSRRYQH